MRSAEEDGQTRTPLIPALPAKEFGLEEPSRSSPTQPSSKDPTREPKRPGQGVTRFSDRLGLPRADGR